MSKKKTQGNNTFYVWIKSERIGQIVEVAEEQSNPAWIQFTDGTQCNSALVHEFLMGADSEDHANKIAVDFGGITTFTKPDAATPVRPRRDIETVDATPVRPRREPATEINVMQEMLKKMSAKNKAEMPVKINIPSKEIYALLKDQMDITKKDLNGQIAALVEDQIDNLREQLKEQIESFITNYYTNVRTNTSTRGNNTSSTESESTDSE